MKPVTVYALRSTRDGAVRYIGQTISSIRVRLNQHRSYAKLQRRTAVHKWIARELSEGFSIEITAIANDAELHVTEIELIAKYRADGCRLLNLTDGGEGTVGWRGNAGNKRPDLSARNSLFKGVVGRPVSEETKLKISAANSGRAKPWVADRNRANAGKPGRAHTPESRAKIGEAHRGKQVSDETRRKLSEKAKGRKLSPEAIEKLRAGHKAYYERINP